MRLGDFARDVDHALRGLRRRPAFTVVAILTLALGVGANATMFGVVDRLLLRPPDHVRDPERVVRFYTTGRSALSRESHTTSLGDYAGFAAVRERGRSFERVAGFLAHDVTLSRGPQAQLVKGSLVTASLFPLLGVRPAFGRFFSEDEDRASAAPVVVLGHEIWRAHFGSDSAVIGRVIFVQGSPYTVVGVAPPGFTGVELGGTDVWLPLHVAAPSVLGMEGTSWQQMYGFWMEFVARLRPGVMPQAADAEATVLFRQSRPEHMLRQPGEEVSVRLGPLIRGRGPTPLAEVRTAKWLAAMSVVVLLVACANVANLLLARAVDRRREVAVRLALGASRGRLVKQLLTESVLLAALGGAAALAVAYWGASALRAVLLPDVDWTTPPVDPRVFAATAVVALGAGLLTGLVPALQASRPDLTAALKLGERSSGSAVHSAARVALLVVQAALSVMLLIGAGLFVRSLRNAQTTDLDMDAERALVAHLDLRGVGYTPPQVAAFYDRAADAVRGLPDVERVSLAASYPFGRGYGGWFEIPGRDSLPTLPSGGPYEYDVSPGYFATLGTPLLRGRDFTDADRAGAPPVVIVNETLARLYWPGSDAVGQCVLLSGPKDQCAQVVGVVANGRRFHIREDPQLMYYVPLAQSAGRHAGASRALVVRPRGDPLAAAQSVRSAIQGLAADLPFVQVSTFAQLVEPQLRPWRLGAAVFSAFGALALVVAAIGLYGVISFGVAQRRGEFGVRMALGATAADLLRMVLGEGVRYAAVGVALGLVASLASASLIASFLYEVSPRDGATYGAVALLLLAVAVVASVVPAWRVTRVDPASVLRAE